MLKNGNIIKRYYNEILTFGLAYSCVIVFALFGPVLLIASKKNTLLFSIISLIFFILAFLRPTYQFKKNKKIYVFLWIIAIVSLGLFSMENMILKSIGVSAYAFLVATICRWWTISAYNKIDIEYSGLIIASCFFISFLILYLINILAPAMNEYLLVSIPVITCGGAINFYRKVNGEFNDEKNTMKIKFQKHIWLHFAFLFIIYICGGVSYSGVYPFLVQFYSIDRYYNVLPFVLGVLIAGMITDRLGKKITFVLGVGFLGISFVFFILEYNVIVYFGIQTFLQLGWAFVNVFGFSYSWHAAKQEKNSRLFGYCIVAIMIGVMAGSFISYYFKVNEMQISIYALVTLIPLFIAIIIYTILLEEKNNSAALKAGEFYNLDLFMNATSREKEVIYQYYCGKTMEEIGKKLFISPNTVKTHIRNVYRKLEISSKRELQRKVKKYEMSEIS